MLDDLVVDDQTVDFVLMDIEGSETFALRGAPRMLQGCETLFVEFIPHHLKLVAKVSVRDFLEPLAGFRFLFVPGPQQVFDRSQFQEVQEHLYANNVAQDFVVFHKSSLRLES